MSLIIHINQNGSLRQVVVDRQQAFIGRASSGLSLDVDLTPDLLVSRRHARVWMQDDGTLWIEDLGSRRGTFVGGEMIEAARALRDGDEIRMGNTTLTVEAPKAVDARPADEPAGKIVGSVDAREVQFMAPRGGQEDFAKRLSQLCELPVQMATHERLEDQCRFALERVREMVPAAAQAVMLVLDEGTGQLLLKAFVPEREPVVSTTLCRSAMEQKRALRWNATEDVESPQSVVSSRMQEAIAAPLMWQEKVLGVLFVYHGDARRRFEGHDLPLLVAVGHYLSLTLAHDQLQRTLRRNASILERLLVTFSPKVRTRLLEHAARGQLRPGGVRSEVAILCSDIRGFVKATTGMEADDVVTMLNDYFDALVRCIFEHDGTIDKFVGDAILAVFGSPEADPAAHEKAVRAAMAMQDAMAEVNRQRKRRKQVTCDIGIGVHCGDVLHGFIGSQDRLEYTVIGEPVNMASRYCDAAKAGEVIISPAMYERVWRSVKAEKIAVPTKHEGEMAGHRVASVT